MNSTRIEVVKTVTEGFGRPTNKDIEFHKCWSEVLDLIGNDMNESLQVKRTNAIIFKVKYCKKLEELRDKEQFKVKWQGRLYTIYHVDFMGYNKQNIKIKCEQIL